MSVPIRLGIMCQRVSRFGLYHARIVVCTGVPLWPWTLTPVGVECLDNRADIDHAVPAVLEFRPSAITWTSAV